MRVGILTASLSRGGAERQATLWAAAVARAGHEVELLGLHARGQEYAVPVSARVDYVGKRGPMDLARVLRAVRGLARRVDVVAAFQPYLGLFCAAQPLAVPWLLVTGEDPRRFADTSRVPTRLLGAGVRRAAVRVAPTRGLVECHRALGLGRDGWEVIPNVAAEEAYSSGEEPRDRQVLWVGRLVEEKDPLLAVEVARRAGVRLTVLGEGPLEAAVRAAGGDRVDLVGFTPEPWPHYRRHAALLLTSRYEAFGNVLVEALAAGTPVVAGDCDFGPREILAGAATSRLVPREPERLAAAVVAVVERAADQEARREARELAEAYRLEALAPRIRATLERVASYERPGSPERSI